MLVVLAPRRPIRGFSRFGLTRLFRKVAALFTASNAAVGPQTFQDHFRSARYGSGVFAICDAQAPDVFQQALDFGELLATLRGGSQFGSPPCIGEVREWRQVDSVFHESDYPGSSTAAARE